MKQFLHQFFYSISLALLAFFCFSTTVTAQSVLFEDNFDEGLSKWDAVRGNLSAWTIQDGMAGTIISIPQTILEIVPKDEYWDTSYGNYIYEYDFIGKSGIDKNFTFRFQGLSKWYEFHHTVDSEGWLTLFLDKVGPGGRTLASKRISPVDNKGFANNLRYHVKISAIDSIISFCITEDNLQQNCILSHEDTNNPILFGKVSLKVSTGSNYPSEIWFDNIRVTTPETTLAVPDLKQSDPAWGTLVYDHLTNSNPTIARWGCALTSATMILQYYGYPVTPGELNSWMKDQPGAFTKGGGVVWAYFSKYAHEHKTSSQPDLEFAYTSTSSAIIKEHLDQGEPVILKYATPAGSSGKMHFTVAKGKNLDAFVINDPGSNTIVNSDDVPSFYGTPLAAVGLMTPSNTDLSYLIIFVSENINLRVFDQSNTFMPTGYQIEHPYVDPITKGTEGISLKAFYLPKPTSAQYRIELESDVPRSFELETYFLDTEGQVKYISIPNTIEGNKPKNYYANFDKENIQESTVKEEVIETEEGSIDALLTSLENAYIDGKIKNPGYISIKIALMNAKKYDLRGRDSLSKLYLRIALIKLKATLKKHKDSQFFQEFSEAINYVLNS